MPNSGLLPATIAGAAARAGAVAYAPGDLGLALDQILMSGGDTRLRVDPVTRLNGYGCRPFPRPEAFTFASSTATSISERAYARAARSREELIVRAQAIGLEGAFEERVERMRRELKALLAVDDSVPVVFSPSGTDSQLHALFIAWSLFGVQPVSVIAAADETGSGTMLASAGRHFNDLTARGVTVEKGTPLVGFAEDAAICVPLRDESGHARAIGEADDAIVDAVASAIGSGRKVLLHVMDRSKHGVRCPSEACIREIDARWPDSVLTVVDACQIRLGKARIARHIDNGHMVLLTGSKFFTGAPFSGALLVPPRISGAVAAVSNVPFGMCDYTNRSDWPAGWHGIRSRLPARRNLGLWLRWESALEEMRSYFGVPRSYRRNALENFAAFTRREIAASPSLEPLTDLTSEAASPAEDGEMAIPTIFPFFVRRNGKLLQRAECATIYAALNRNVADRLPPSASAEDRQVAARLCHIGQPVALRLPGGETAATLRISAGARVVTESWLPDGDPTGARLGWQLEQVATILRKIELMANNLEAVAAH